MAPMNFNCRLVTNLLLVSLTAVAFIGNSAFAGGEARLIVEAGKPAGKISPLMYGLMTEEINHSYDGGLYAELVRNRVFLEDEHEPLAWSLVQDKGSAATMTLDQSEPLNQHLPVSLRLNVTQASPSAVAGVSNSGYWGIGVQSNTRYLATFYAKAAAGFSGPITLSIQSTDGRTTYATAKVEGLSTEWNRYQTELRTPADITPTSHACYRLTIDRPGTIWLDLVSLFPPTWNDRPNGVRKDIMQMLVDLHPKFLRFPGGAFLEGFSMETRYQWKKTIGPLTQRPGHRGLWGYYASDGLGLLEFLQWCQDMGAEPVLAVFAGYVSSTDGTHIKPGPKLQPFVQEALEEIEYVTGDQTTTWGARRAADGHPEPFPLHYIEIGNEDFFDKSNSYDGRFTQFYDAIKANYPQLKIISTAPKELWKDSAVHSRAPDAVDEHYYRPAEEFIAISTDYYEKYPRVKRPEIFVGEWASFDDPKAPPWTAAGHRLPPTANFKDALGDAAWMTAMERNADLVVMNCYAPLLVNVNGGAWQWRPDLIAYDALHVYGSPTYYAFRMFSTNLGDQRLAVTTTNTAVQASATRDGGKVFLKLVNPTSAGESLHVELRGIWAVEPTATAITMAADPGATNSLTEPTRVAPTTSTVPGMKPDFHFKVPPFSITVLTVSVEGR
jgi:alpha-N-arabinofuranosidase